MVTNKNLGRKSNINLDRLQELIDLHANGVKKDFAAMFGVTKSAFQNYAKAHRNMPPDLIRAICDRYNIPITWLTENPTNEAQEVMVSPIIKVPIVTRHEYAVFVKNFDKPKFMSGLSKISHPLKQTEQNIDPCFEVLGDSLEGEGRSFYEGDLAYTRRIELKLRRFNLGKIHVVVSAEHGIIFRVIEHFDSATDTLHLKALNPAYEDLTINLDNVLVLYRVTAFHSRV